MAVAAMTALYSLVAIPQAQAHGFGARYDLPIPLSLYLTGAGLTVALSFAMLALFMRSAPASDAYWRFNLTRTTCGRLLGAPGVLLVCRALAVALFLLIVAAGLFGIQSPLKNIAPVMVWAIWWVGMAYISALLGNVWALVNPLDTLFVCAETLWTRCHRRLIAELLVARGHKVIHLIRPGRRERHRLYDESEVRDGRLYLCGSLVA